LIFERVGVCGKSDLGSMLIW